MKLDKNAEYYNFTKSMSFERKGNASHTHRELTRTGTVSQILPREDGWWVVQQFTRMTEAHARQEILKERLKKFGYQEILAW